MTYAECLDFLYEQLPMYQREGATAFKKDLTNVQTLCRLLDNPQERYKIIHVAGTNGKGSVCHMLAAILQSEGFTVGLYTSPHYYDFRERIKINGELIGEQDVVSLVSSLKEQIELIQPSFFELTVAMAFSHFALKGVDFAIIETGLGGRLDSTNIVRPILSVITNISFDHQAMLGDTLPLIAEEKAGIIKPQVPVVIGERHHETDAVFERKALENDAPLRFAEDGTYLEKLQFSDQGFTAVARLSTQNVSYNLKSGLRGRYQINNLRSALAATAMLCDYHGICISAPAIEKGLLRIESLTGFNGRWQILQEKPLMIADSGHNIGGLRLAMKQLSEFHDRRIHLVFGVVKDKSYREMLDLLPNTAVFYWCAAALPRALDSQTLMEEARQHGLYGEAYESVAQAVKFALQKAEESDLIFVGGSSFVVGEVLALMTPPIALD